MLDSMAAIRGARLWPLALVPVLTACSDGPTSALGGGTTLAGGISCDLPTSLLADGGPGPNGIPALTNPRMVGPDHEFAAYLEDDDRVLGLAMGGEARAYPHNILWWHEIVNDEFGDRSIAVTFCPLTGSGIVFDRASMGDPGLDLGVSGLLFASNLMMYDRRTGRLIGPQMSVEGRCGPFRGVAPQLLGVTETTWGRWKALHPETRVVSDVTGHIRDYTLYPYGTYASLRDESLLVPMSIDRSRPPKELVLGFRSTRPGEGIAYPFGELAELAPRGVVNDEVEGRPVAIFFERGEDASGGTAVAFDRRVDGVTLTFEWTGAGFRDRETGTTWDFAGRATDGPRAGDQLALVESAYVAFWFAWRHFEPDSRTFEAPS